MENCDTEAVIVYYSETESPHLYELDLGPGQAVFLTSSARNISACYVDQTPEARERRTHNHPLVRILKAVD